MLTPGRRCLLICALLSVMIVPVSAQSNGTSTAQQVESLQRQLTELQGQMDQVQAELKQLSTNSGTNGARASQATTGNAQRPDGTIETTATSEAQTKQDVVNELNSSTKRELGKSVTTYIIYSQDTEAAPRMDNAPLDPRYPGYFRLPGTATLLKVGGYFKSDFIRDIRPAGDTERFIPSSFPVPSSGGTTNSTVSIRPTRLNLDFLIPFEGAGSARFFIEGDLFGSSATTPRLRHAYAQAKNFLIGQTFSNFQNPDAGPDQLDFQGPNSQVSIRNPQFRYSIPLAKKTSFRLSLEKASSDVAFSTPEFKALPSNQLPDGVITFRQEGDRGNLQLSGLFRSVGAFLPNGVSDSVFGWGVHASGAIKPFSLDSSKPFGLDTIVYQVAYGHGIERYLNDTSGLGIDATVISAQSPRLRALPVVATYGSYQHYWIKSLRSSAMYGFVGVDNTPFQGTSAFHRSHYTAANLIWNPVGSLNLGAEFLYGWVVKKDSSSGNAPRLMVSAKWSFVKQQPPPSK